ncbi:AAA family ATPase [Spirosoma rhododendri]|uniref:AAA family ATPase n=1 Tax=Spirosoma rhododendri TaxID=2728024 RepID=A0A7L5DPY5_9BACT|nr:AAA family ATPase [Spirosoma rhododendri]QJD79642.1 AAA family ATPase [Spirosoma rhododendri]
MPNFVISGGPGAGKTTLLNALQTAGYHTVDEASRVLIQEQVAEGGRCLPWVDLPCFARLALHRMIFDYHQTSTQPGSSATFFDRGIPDIVAYLRVAGLPVDSAFYEAVQQYPYQQQVFMAPPWEAIYVNDSERWQTFAEATSLHNALVDTYLSLGFTIVPLPLAPVADRVAFIQQTVSSCNVL